MILSDPFTRPPAPPIGRLRRAWERLAAIVETPVAWGLGVVLSYCIIKGGFGK